MCIWGGRYNWSKWMIGKQLSLCLRLFITTWRQSFPANMSDGPSGRSSSKRPMKTGISYSWWPGVRPSTMVLPASLPSTHLWCTGMIYFWPADKGGKYPGLGPWMDYQEVQVQAASEWQPRYSGWLWKIVMRASDWPFMWDHPWVCGRG